MNIEQEIASIKGTLELFAMRLDEMEKGSKYDGNVLPDIDEGGDPKPEYMDPNEFWQGLFSEQPGFGIDIPGFGKLTLWECYPGLSISRNLLMWEWSGLKSTQYFGLGADFRSSKLAEYKPMLDVLFQDCGPKWLLKYVPTSQTGLSSEMTGVPYSYPCRMKQVVGLK